MLSAVRALRTRLRESFGSFERVFRNPNIRRIELAWTASIIAHWAYGVALAVYAYDKGGAAAVGLVGLIRFIPPAFASPLMAMLADRVGRKQIIVGADVVRALLLAPAAVAIFADASEYLVYTLAGLVAIAYSAVRPATAALMPTLARSPAELTAANITTSTVESVGIFAGPALGGLLLAATDAGTVFAVSAAAFAFAAFMVARVDAGPAPERAPRTGVVGEFFAGFRTLGADPALRVMVILLVAQTTVAGALNVLLVVSALDLLELGEQGVGFLNSAVGVGGLAGAVVAALLVGRNRLAADFGVGIVLWGLPIALAGVFPETAAVLLLLAVVGLGNTLVDISAFTLLQRAVPDEVLARAFGALQALWVGTIGVGAIIAPLVIAALGIRGALIATGVFLPILAALLWRPLSALDEAAVAPERELALLRGLDLFAPLPAATLEALASALERMRVEPGREIVQQGEPGDRFYIVSEGEVEVDVDGRVVALTGPGGYFGEIALLRDVARTATVRARGEVELRALGRDDFIAAVTGHAASADAADSVIATRLRELRPGLASV